jgi:hypothetical protein
LNEKLEKLFNDLTDIIDVLRQQEKCGCDEFRGRWLKKHKDVQERLGELTQQEYEELNVLYTDWFKKQNYETANTLRSQGVVK